MKPKTAYIKCEILEGMLANEKAFKIKDINGNKSSGFVHQDLTRKESLLQIQEIAQKGRNSLIYLPGRERDIVKVYLNK